MLTKEILITAAITLAVAPVANFLTSGKMVSHGEILASLISRPEELATTEVQEGEEEPVSVTLVPPEELKTQQEESEFTEEELNILRYGTEEEIAILKKWKQTQVDSQLEDGFTVRPLSPDREKTIAKNGLDDTQQEEASDSWDKTYQSWLEQQKVKQQELKEEIAELQRELEQLLAMIETDPAKADDPEVMYRIAWISYMKSSTTEDTASARKLGEKALNLYSAKGDEEGIKKADTLIAEIDGLHEIYQESGR